MQNKHHQKSGQAIIFLMVVVVIGLVVVIWNFDLHRIISAKIRVRNATDAAAMSAARWQGVTLNMIGDLNLIQAALLAEAAEQQEGNAIFEVPASAAELHELRSRLAFIGPLAAFSIAQQVAFDNGAFHDPELATNLQALAESLRLAKNQGSQPYDNACEDYADLLDQIVEQGVAVSSYTVSEGKHPWTQKAFYSGISEGLAGNWYGLMDYKYQLENFETLDAWSIPSTELKPYYMLDLKLSEFRSRSLGDDASVNYVRPSTSMSTNMGEYLSYIGADDRGILAAIGAETNYLADGIWPIEPDNDIWWHIFGSDWQDTWPAPLDGATDQDDLSKYFPLWEEVQDKYNYLGAEAGFSIAAPVHRGILADAVSKSVTLEYKAKAKPFGYLEAPLQDATPCYYGFVFPEFTDVYLIHSDIGDEQVDELFYDHVRTHLAEFEEGGPDALHDGCPYCQLLKAWDELDKEEALKWIEAMEGEEDTADEPDDDDGAMLRGGATRGT
jgi:hypothetical protein